jgi:uncharacterized membrane protein
MPKRGIDRIRSLVLARVLRPTVPLVAWARAEKAMILGWRLFDFVEGVIDHHLLNIHHVRDIPFRVPASDWM